MSETWYSARISSVPLANRGNSYYIGGFDTKEKAAIAYDQFVVTKQRQNDFGRIDRRVPYHLNYPKMTDQEREKALPVKYTKHCGTPDKETGLIGVECVEQHSIIWKGRYTKHCGTPDKETGLIGVECVVCVAVLSHVSIDRSRSWTGRSKRLGKHSLLRTLPIFLLRHVLRFCEPIAVHVYAPDKYRAYFRHKFVTIAATKGYRSYNFLAEFDTKEEAGIAYDRFVVDKSTKEITYTMNYGLPNRPIKKKNKLQVNNTSGFRGVVKHGNKYRVQLEIKGIKRKVYGTYPTPRKAALAYDQVVLQKCRPREWLNFPLEINKHGDKYTYGRYLLDKAEAANEQAKERQKKQNRLNKVDVYVGTWSDDGKKHGYGKMTYYDGSVYDGTWKDDKRDGHGTLIDPKGSGSKYVGAWVNDERSGLGEIIVYDSDLNRGSEYVGNWKHNYPNGHGTQTWNNGDKYVGTYGNGVKSGFGAFTYVNGDIYVGAWKNDARNGRGKMKYGSGGKYVGAWVDGERHGKGKMRNAIGKYVGHWTGGKKHGEGTFTYASGGKYVEYVGAWMGDAKHGQGTLTYANGNEYVGMWRLGRRCCWQVQRTSWSEPVSPSPFDKGKMIGEGVMTYANGDRYVGQWRNNKITGQGKFTWADGREYVGMWRSGKRHCHMQDGTMTWPDGRSYVGKWSQDKMDGGQGTFTWADGGTYVGNWVNDQMNGFGTCTWADGRTYVGKWKNGQQEFDGSMTYANGRTYVGKWRNGKRDGEGKETWPDGKEYVGLWKEGEKEGHGVLKYSDSGTSWIVEEVNEKMVRVGSYNVGQRANKIENWLKKKRERNEVVIHRVRKKAKITLLADWRA